MKYGLYNRDYSRLTEEERLEKEKIDALNTSRSMGGLMVHRGSNRDYSKAVRHNMSLFPNNYLDASDLKEAQEMLRAQCECFKKQLDDQSSTESDLQARIKEACAYHIPGSLFSLFNFGHHGAYLFKEFRLGTSYVADYVLVGKSSDGYFFVFVEFENPYNHIVRQDGLFGETINKGISQIRDWKAFLAGHYAAIADEFKHYSAETSLPVEFSEYDPTRMHFIVVAGRRSDFQKKTYLLARALQDDSKILVTHYDTLYECAIELLGKNTY